MVRQQRNMFHVNNSCDGKLSSTCYMDNVWCLIYMCLEHGYLSHDDLRELFQKTTRMSYHQQMMCSDNVLYHELE